MRNTTKTQKLTVLLIKDSIPDFKAALRDSSSLEHIPLKKGLYRGEFWYAHPTVRTPTWQAFVNPILEFQIPDLTASSVSAVLFVKAKNRIFAFTFGYGRNLLRPDSYELRFGLKVALNRIDHERIRSIDIRTYEDLMVSTRKQTSRSAEFYAFGLDVSRDLLRAVTGEPRDHTFAKRLTGADALTINVQIKASELPSKCEELLQAYNDDTYKQHFEWVDHLNEVRDKSLVEILNAKLVNALRSGSIQNLHLAPPEPLDWQSVEKFRIQGTGQTEYFDLDIEEYLTALGEKRRNLTIEKLKRCQVSLRWTGGAQFQNKWSVFNCIVWETTENGRLYAIAEGRWFEIERNFARRVRKFLEDVHVTSNLLPPAKSNEKEEEYNRRVARNRRSKLICLDRVLVTPEDGPSKIEFCDLLSLSGQFIHVKKKTRSSTLSHLFAQGTVAGRVFLQDGRAREQLRKYLSAKKRSKFRSLIPNASTRPNPTKYEIAYAIISKRNAKGKFVLPFFSQLNLMQNAKILQGLGYKVTLRYVPEEEEL